MKGSRMSLNSSAKPGESDTDSMAEYGEGETGELCVEFEFSLKWRIYKRMFLITVLCFS